MPSLYTTLIILLACLSTQAKEAAGVSKMEIVFSVGAHPDKEKNNTSITKSQKASIEKLIKDCLADIALTTKSAKWDKNDDFHITLPALGEAIRKDVIAKINRELTVKTQYLSLNLVHPDSRTLAPRIAADPTTPVPPGYKLTTLHDTDDNDRPIREPLLIWKTPVLDSSFIKFAQELYGPYEGKLSVELNEAGAKKMFAATKEMKHGSDRLAIILDGKVLSAPIVQSSLGKKFEISGMKDAEEAKKTATALMLPPKRPLKIKSINPPLAK